MKLLEIILTRRELFSGKNQRQLNDYMEAG